MKRTIIPAFCIVFLVLSQDPARSQGKYKTENVIIAVMDGTTWHTTFGDPEHRLIPRMWNELRPSGALYSNFFNQDVTITKAGHATISTGTWQKIRNRGPRCTMPTVFDYMADELQIPDSKAWVVFGKGVYAYDPTTSFPAYRDRFKPYTEIGIGESTLQNDTDVFHKILKAMETERPKIIFANFGATDHLAHSGIWERHAKAVQGQDELFADLWEAIQGNPHYRDKTTLFLLNDHGYHTDGVREGFAEHGDSCEGCRHIMLLILGPDTKKGAVVNRIAHLTDIAPTVGELLSFQTPLAHGEVLKDSLVEYLGVNQKQAKTEAAKKAVAAYEEANRNLVRQLADRVLERGKSGDSLLPSVDTAFLLWGMLSAYDKTGEARDLDFVRSWAEENLAGQGDPTAYTGLVLSELTYRLPRDDKHKYTEAAKAIAEQMSPQIEAGSFRDRTNELAVDAIFLASIAEVTREYRFWLKAKDLLLEYVREMDFQAAQKTALTVQDLNLKAGEDVVRQEGKVLPTTQAPSGVANDPWILLAVAFVRSHGLPFKGEYFIDVPDLREEGFLQTFLAVNELSGSGEIWANPLHAALNIAGIREFQRRVNLFERAKEDLTEFDIVRLRPRSPEILPGFDEMRQQVRLKVTATNYNVEYGFPLYTEFDYTTDLLRLHVDDAETDLEKGAFLLALDPERRVPFEPQFSPDRPGATETPR